jgi:hypothetical protein
MLRTLFAASDGEPVGEPIGRDAIGIVSMRAARDGTERAWIEIGMPNDPRLGGLDLRALGESESPIAADRRLGDDPLLPPRT